MTALLILDRESENLLLPERQELLGHIDSCLANSRQYLTTTSSRQSHGGIIEGHQTTFATFYGRHDRHTDAETLFLDAIAMQNQELGRSHIATLRSMGNLGVLYLETENLARAEEIIKGNLDMKEKLLGPDHPLTLNTVNNLGNLYAMRLMYDKATEMHLPRILGGHPSSMPFSA
jgi:hypothetical protein